MAAKIKCALFSSRTLVRTEADGSPVYQPSTTCVLETSTTKRFTGITFAINTDSTGKKERVLLKVTNSSCLKDTESLAILASLDNIADYSTSAKVGISSKTDVELIEKLDYFFYGNNSNKFSSPYLLKDKDVNGLTLKDFITAEYTFVDSDIKDVFVDSNNSIRKFALDERTIDWTLFWNSPFITKDEKDYCRCAIDLDICMSNSDKDMFKVLQRTFTTVYPERNWTLNILFGDPSSGKTTMIQNLCSLIGAPLVKLTGDPTISMTKLIMTVGPENIVHQMQDKQFFVDKLKSAGIDDNTIASLDSEIAKAILTSKETDVQLTEQDSIILKCKKHDLPLVVLLDEINMFTTLLQATLADVITSGYVNVGVHTYKSNPSNIIWFGAYNPNTYKASPFELKFRDRALFFCSEMPTEKQLIAHKQRKNQAIMLGTHSVMNDLEVKVNNFKEKYPELNDQVDGIFNMISNIVQVSLPSKEAVDWFFDYQTDKLLGKNKLSFKEGKFTNAYKKDITLASADSINEATSRMLKYVNKVNEILINITKGIDLKNPDNNFSFYIPNRAVDYFFDLIHCFSSVDKATDFMIYNLIPNGDTCRYGTDFNPASIISSSVRTSLQTDIDELQKFLFSDFDASLEIDAVNKATDNDYKSDLWIVSSDTTNVVTEEDFDDGTTEDKVLSILDEAEELEL